MRILAIIFAFLPAIVCADGLTIHAAETVIGRFHRFDNKVHPYEPGNAWLPYILKEDSEIHTPLVVHNTDGSYTIFFNHLKELFQTMSNISNSTGRKVRVFNINAHGMPGGVWFPRDVNEMDNQACADWREVAESDDEISYNQYYTALSKSQIFQIRQMSRVQDASIYGCVNGLAKWQQTVSEVPSVKNVFTDDAQINFMSCVVGFGNAGERFTKGLGQLLLGSQGVVRTAIKFGLGDWSMDQGMGFWDYINDEQLRKDNQTYPVTKEDRLIYQTGDVRVARMVRDVWTTVISPSQSYMYLHFTPVSPLEQRELDFSVLIRSVPAFLRTDMAPLEVKLPRTAIFVRRVH